MNKQKSSINNYGVNLTMLWVWLWIMNLFALADTKKGSEVIQSHVIEAFHRVTSKVHLICKNYIFMNRNLIIASYLNQQSVNSDTNIAKTESVVSNFDANESIVKQKKSIQEQNAKQTQLLAEQKRKATDSATLFCYENELVKYVQSVVDKSNSYVYGYMRKIQRKNPRIIVDISNPLDDFQFDVHDFYIRLEAK